MLKLAFQGDASAEIVAFGKFVANDLSKVTNGFEAWSQIPIFVFNAQLVRKLRSADRRTGDVHRIDFSHSETSRPLHVDIAPALLLSADGATQVAHYPGPREEGVLEVLYRIATEQGCGVHAGDRIAGVRFTFALVRQHLKRHNHGMNYPDIALSLRILQNTRLSIFSKDMIDPLYEGAPLPQIIRDDSGTNRKEIARIAEFPWPVARMIGSANYRQLDYGVLMTLKRPIARWLYRRLCFRWINADMTNTYHFKFTTVLETGYLHSLRSDRQRKLIDQALDELVANGVIRSEPGRRVVYGGARGIDILDVVYTVSATQEFTVAQRAANRRAKEGCVGDGAPGGSALTDAGPMPTPARRVARETRPR